MDSEQTPTSGRIRALGDWLQRAFERASADQRFWALTIAVGVLAGVVAAGVVELLAFVKDVAWPPGPTFLDQVRAASPVHRVTVLTVGGLLVGAVALLMGRSLGGHGTAGIIEAIWRRGGLYSARRAIVNGVMAIVSVGLGAPLGREGAVMSTSAGAASFLARRFKVDPDRMRVLVACGASAGIAAAYNVPLGASLFGLEVLLGSFALELLGPIVLSCTVGTLVSRMLVSSHPAFVIPNYELSRPRELLIFLALAPLFGLASALYVRTIEGFSVLGSRVGPRLAFVGPPAAMGVIGLVAWAFPEILGNGYEPVNDALLGRVALPMLLLLPLLKMLATGLASGAAVPGGLFTPSLFFGALLGGALGTALELVWPLGVPPGAYALVGMCAVLAGTTHATTSSVLIIFEMTRDYGIVLPLMLASFVSMMVSRRFAPHSLYASVLVRRNVVPPLAPMPPWWEGRTVASRLSVSFSAVSPALSFNEVAVRLLALAPGRDLHVVDADGRYRGSLVLDALKGHLPQERELAGAVAADVMDVRVAPLPLAGSLDEAAARFAASGREELPVVDAAGKLVGTLTRGAIGNHPT